MRFPPDCHARMAIAKRLAMTDCMDFLQRHRWILVVIVVFATFVLLASSLAPFFAYI